MKNIFSIYLLLINIISFIIYFIDKRKAIKNKWRIPEKILLLFSLIGGCYGSLIGMYFHHHKTKHIKFKILVPLFVIIWTYILFKIFVEQ